MCLGSISKMPYLLRERNEFRAQTALMNIWVESRLAFLLILEVVFIVFILVGMAQALTADGEALLMFKFNLNDSGAVLSNWSQSDADPCHWLGVTCDSSNRVISLNLPNSRLWGSISPDLGRLNKLRRLGLHRNSLYGNIPPELGNCSKLRALYLQSNFLSGSIPPELGNLTDMMILDISSNAFTQTIPSSLGNLKRLKYMNVSANFLVGQIPNGVLASIPGAFFAGNLNLCGQQIDVICKSELEGYPSSHNLRDPDETRLAGQTSPKERQFVDGLLISAMSTLGFSFAMVLMCFWGYFSYNKYSARYNALSEAQKATGSSPTLAVFHGDLPYASDDIAEKIKNLDDSDIVGVGGFGTVFKLVMDDKSIFALKKIELTGKKSRHIFDRELEILGSFKHRNLVNLRGYCNSSTANLLIYDYLPSGSLDEYLHERSPKEPLTWLARLKIALGAARGLAYLHHDCFPRIVHRDIKSSNILLDEKLEAHVSDFGLAKLLEENESHVTTIVAGTFGYLAPEYMLSGRATEKTDVYSFGIVLLELVCGKRPADVSFIEKGLNVVGWVQQLMKEDRCLDIVDPNCKEVPVESLESMLYIATMCTSTAPKDRPCMNKVVRMLEADTVSPCPSDFYDSNSD
eukprot:c16984_g1_i1 orf=301-2196(+)